MDDIKKHILYLLLVISSLQWGWSQNQWDIQLSLDNVDCANNTACYTLELRSASGSDWALGDQNYRLFFDGDLMTVTGVSSLLPGTFYGSANIDQNVKISGMGQESSSPLDDIDDNLGFLDFSIVQTDNSNPAGAAQISTGGFIAVAQICVDVAPSVINDASGASCLAFYHSRPSTAGSITSQYTTITENDVANSTSQTTGATYDDLTSANGADACLGPACVPSPNEWDIQLSLDDVDCANNTACYTLELRSASGSDWALGDQNYRLFFDGDLMTVTGVSSLLPGTFYGSANIDQNVKISGMGQESSSPLDDIDDNLGFLDFSIVQTDNSNPAGAAQISTGGFIAVAQICVDVAPSVINDASGASCLAFYHSRPSTAGSITSQYTTITENDVANSTSQTTGATYDDLTSANGADACLGPACVPSPNEWDIQLSLDDVDCANNTACYTLELRSASGSDWALGDQNYRLFFDGDLMTVTGVSSLLPGTFYGSANIDQNVKISGMGQESSSPLDDIDDNLGFLDFSIVQTDNSNPAGAAQISTGGFIAVAQICVDVAPSVINDASGASCLAFYHSRPSTAGSITSQYTTITENDVANSTVLTTGSTFNDVINDCLLGTCGTVSGQLYLDTNGNGIQDAGELGLADVDVVITDSEGNVQTVTTDANGGWVAIVPPGTTTTDVDETDPDFPVGSVQTQGDDPTSVTAVANMTISGGIDGYQLCLTIEAWVYLEGSAIDETGQQNYNVPMRRNLNDLSVLPGQVYMDPFFGAVYSTPGQPYSGAPWNYNGQEGAEFDSGGDMNFADAAYPATVTDWVLVSLRDTPDGSGGTICQTAALLHEDGTIEFVDELACCSIDLTQSYYLVIEHRNHLVVMSHESVDIVNGKLTYDFRNQESYVDDPFGFGTFVGQKEILPGVFAMYAGNGNQTDTGTSDTDINFDDRTYWENENGILDDYRTGDYNMNGDTNFNDRTTWENNNDSFTSVPRD